MLQWRERPLPFSPRGEELFWNRSSHGCDKTVVTIENYCKWYSLFLVHPGGSIEAVDFPDLGNYEKLGSPYVDHEPNPAHVLAWAMYHDYEVDPDTLRAIEYRWHTDVGSFECPSIAPEDTLGENWREIVKAALERRKATR